MANAESPLAKPFRRIFKRLQSKPKPPTPSPPPQETGDEARRAGDEGAQSTLQLATDSTPAEHASAPQQEPILAVSQPEPSPPVISELPETTPAPTPAPAPVTESAPAPTPAAEPELAPAPVSEPAPVPIPVAEPEPESTLEPAPEPLSEPAPAPAPVVEPAPSPAAEPEPESALEPAPAPMLEPTPIPVTGPESERVPEPVPAPATEAAPGPAPELVPAPVTKAAPEPAPEPVPEQSPVQSPEPSLEPSPAPATVDPVPDDNLSVASTPSQPPVETDPESTVHSDATSDSVQADEATQVVEVQPAAVPVPSQIESHIPRESALETPQRAEEAPVSIEDVNQLADEREEQNVLNLLSSVNIDSKHLRLRKRINDNVKTSGQWLLDEAVYKRWRSTPEKYLWLQGRAGCGKSYICSTVIESLKEDLVKDHSRALAYWYIQYDQADTQNADNLVSSLIRQLAAAMWLFPEKIRSLVHDHVDQNSRPSSEELVQVLDSIISTIDKEVYIVIDGLNECPLGEGGKDRKDLLAVIGTLVQRDYDNIHLLIVGREEPDIKDYLSQLGSDGKDPFDVFNVEEGVASDIKAFVSNRVASDKHLTGLTKRVKKSISNRLTKNEDDKGSKSPSFLWVASILQDMVDCHGDEKAVKLKMRNIAPTMEKRYEETLHKVNWEDSEKLKTVLHLLSESMRPLTKGEIALLSGVPNAKELDRICPATLARSRRDYLPVSGETHAQSREVFAFVHFSVKEYLESPRLKQSKNTKLARFSTEERERHAYIAKKCLDCLLTEVEDPFTSYYMAESTREYAARNWFRHVGIATEEEFLSQFQESPIRRLLQSTSPIFHSWLQVFNPDSDSVLGTKDAGRWNPRDPSNFGPPLYYAIHLGLLVTAEQIIKEDYIDINLPGGLGGTPLQLAAFRGYKKTVQQLLDRGADVNVPGKQHGSALYAAASQGNVELVQKFLGLRADTNMREDAAFGNALQVAAYNGFDDIVRLIIAHGADVNAAGGVMSNALHAAAVSGHLQTVSILLECGAQVNKIGGPLGTALQAALTGGFDEVVAKLEAEGAERDRHGLACWINVYESFGADSYTLAENNLVHGEFPEIILHGQQIPRELVLGGQRLVAAALVRSQLPHLDMLQVSMDRLQRYFLLKTPFYYQLRAIQRVIPHFVADLADLSKDGFKYRALFWAGIDAVLEALPYLVGDFIDEIKHNPPNNYDSNNDDPDAPQADAADFLSYADNLDARSETAWPHAHKPEYPLLNREHHYSFTTGYELSDLSVVQFAQERAKAEAAPESSSAAAAAELVPGGVALGGVLELVAEIVQVGAAVDYYERAVAALADKGPAAQLAEGIGELCYELFLTLARLVRLVDVRDPKAIRLAAIRPKVRLLRAVRLARIRELDGFCRQQLALQAPPPPPANLADDVSAGVAGQLQALVAQQAAEIRDDAARQLQGLQAGLLADVQARIAAHIEAELTKFSERIIAEVADKMRLELSKRFPAADPAA
ncbi:hypothetical protein GGS23DRAFT_411032 [Durotheca rogersii]|uniref:uncharacterized protein n=1 Tax=Durotheca rogersii TaxID=419775 RepID=UPI00221E60A1|nr:uncharacterized protein GGS23DRAFT_411032 [Durotheca rogersii]KAI5865136.1 hypothetical protein GGS23DRAFT_411032 [Durotheca rogersii]